MNGYRRRIDDSTVPFGKYRGQPMAALMADDGYCSWLVNSIPDLSTKWPTIHAALISKYKNASSQVKDSSSTNTPSGVDMSCLPEIPGLGAGFSREHKINSTFPSRMIGTSRYQSPFTTTSTTSAYFASPQSSSPDELASMKAKLKQLSTTS